MKTYKQNTLPLNFEFEQQRKKVLKMRNVNAVLEGTLKAIYYPNSIQSSIWIR